MISEEIRQARRNGLGGSDIAGIIPCRENATGTLSPFVTQVQVWNSKLHPEDDIREETEAMWWGSEEEMLNAKRFTELTGKRLVNHNRMIVDGELIANVDRLIVPDGQKIAAYHGEIRTNEIFEAKNSSHEWDDCDTLAILPSGIEVKDGSVGIPAYYQTQGNHYMGRCPTVEQMWFGVKFTVPYGRFCRTAYGVYLLKRDDEIIRAQDAYAREWWQRHIVHGDKPDAVCEEDCKILWRSSIPNTYITVTPEIIDLYRKARSASVDKAIAEQREKDAKGELKKAMGDNEAIVGNDGDTVFATWKNAKDKTVTKTDWESVAKAMADTPERQAVLDSAVAKFTETTVRPGARTFLLKSTEKVNRYLDSLVFGPTGNDGDLAVDDSGKVSEGAAA